MAYNKIPNYLVLDFETSGLDKTNKQSNSNLCAITQVAMVLIDGTSFQEIARVQEYILPYDSKHEYQKQAQEITGIDKQFLYGKGKVLKNVIKTISDIVKEHNNGMYKTTVVGMNIMFDLDFLMFAHKWSKIDISTVYHCGLNNGVYQPHYIDVMDLAKLTTQTANHYNLGSVCAMLDIDYAEGHDAMNDVLMTLDVFKAFMNKLRNTSTTESVVDSVRKHFEF